MVVTLVPSALDTEVRGKPINYIIIAVKVNMFVPGLQCVIYKSTIDVLNLIHYEQVVAVTFTVLLVTMPVLLLCIISLVPLALAAFLRSMAIEFKVYKL